MFPTPHFSLEPRKQLAGQTILIAMSFTHSLINIAIPNLPTSCVIMEPSLHINVRPAGAPETGRLPAERRDHFHPAITSLDPDLLFLSPSILENFAGMQ